MIGLVALGVLLVLATSVYADFWANDGLGPTGNVIKKYNTDGTYSSISLSTDSYDVRKMKYYDGYVYTVDVGGGVVKRWSSVDGTLDADWSISAGLPFGIGFDNAGILYLSVLGAAQNVNQVYRYDRETATPDGWVTSGYAIGQPGDIAFDSAGKLYLTDGPNNAIVRFNTDGTFDTIFAQYNELSNPTCLTFDAAGKLYTGNWNNASIQRWSADGIYEGTLPAYASYINQIAFQGDELLAKYAGYGTYSVVPGEIADGVISGEWTATADSKEDWGWSRMGLAVVPVAPALGWINVQVSFEDFNGDKALLPVKIELYRGGVTVGNPRIVFLVNGSYTLMNLSAGTDYTVAVSAAKFLRKSVPVTVVGGQGTDSPITLKNGDLDGDNQVTSTDISVLLKNLDAIGD